MKFNKHLLDVERKITNIHLKSSGRRLHMCERTAPFPEEFFKEFMLNLTQDDFINYPDSNELKQRIASRNGVSKENVFIGPGSDFVLSVLFNVFIEPETKALMPEAHFPMYSVYLAQSQGTPLHLKYYLDDHSCLKLDIKSSPFLDDHNLQLIVIGNPNSPVGDLIDLEDVELLKSTGLPLVVDQAYSDFGKTDIPLEWVTNGNVILVNTFSKGYGGAGIRVGYCIANKEIIDIMNKLRLPFEVSGVSQKFAAFLMYRFAVHDKYVKEIISERTRLAAFIQHVQYGNWIHIPEGFFYEFINRHTVREHVYLPCIKRAFSRVTIFSGITDELLKAV